MTDQVSTAGDPGKQQTLFNSPDQGTDNKSLELTKEQLEQILKQNSHAQNHIKQIEEDNRKLREQLQGLSKELETSTQFDDLLAGLASSKSSTNSSEQTAPLLDKNQLLSELKAEIFNELSNSQRAAMEEENLRASIQTAQQKFGAGYEKELLNLAQELDLTPEYLESLARTSPKAFATVIGNSKTKTPFSPTINSFRTEPLNSTDLDISRVAKARNLNTPEGREAERQWRDPEFQRKARQQILARLAEKGSEFGNN